MPWLLYSVLTLHRSVQLKMNADVNWNCETHPKTKACAKQNAIMLCQQCNKPGATRHSRAWLAQRLWTETNYVN